MSTPPQRLQDYLGHILDAIGQISAYTAGMDEQRFQKERMAQDAVIRNFEIIGEASRNIQERYPDFAAKYPDSALLKAWEMRNRLIHGYFDINMNMAVVWKTIQDSLPALQEQVQQALAALEG